MCFSKWKNVLKNCRSDKWLISNVINLGRVGQKVRSYVVEWFSVWLCITNVFVGSLA